MRCPARPLTALLAACALAGCAAPRALNPPVPVDGLSFSASGEAPVADAWWTALGDPALDDLVRSALADNFTVQAALARVEAAEALVVVARAPLFPSVSAGADANLSSDGPLAGGTRSPLGVALDVQWELDLWGRVRAEGNAAQARAEASRHDARAAAVALSAELARAWIAAAEAAEQLAVLDQQLALNEDLVEVVQARVVHGVEGSAELLRQRSVLERAQAARIAWVADLQVLEHRLAVLAGRPPQEGIGALPTTLPALPSLPAAGVPADLLLRRPDLLAAQQSLRAADRDLAAAVADQFPTITLDAGLSSAPTNPADLLQAWVASLGASLLAPLVEGGARRAEVRRSRAVVEERLAGFGQAVLVALQEVEDALAREAGQREGVANLERQLELAGLTVERLSARYAGGMGVEYVDVVRAREDEQSLRRQLVTARRQHLEHYVDLYRALAGGLELVPTSSEEGS